LRGRTGDFVRAIAETKVPIFVLFPGHDNTASDDDNYKSFAEHANALLAATPGLDLAIENWPGPHNAFIAVTPAGWAKLFALIPDRRFGLEFDPSHLIRLGVDPYSAFEGVKDRLKILHGKDTTIEPEKLQAVGYHGAGWWRYSLPGKGRLDWSKFLRQVKATGFDGTISIEHEDSDFGWPGKDLAARKEGERQGLDFLRRTLVAL
jgi:sugar phosphate isomerase/epimerase